MRTIWKYTLTLEDEQAIEMPVMAQILSVHIQNGALCVWALVDPQARKEMRTFWIRGTGHEVSEEMETSLFVGTVLMLGHELVWHVFVRP